MTDDLPGLVALCRQAEAACEHHRREQLRLAGYPDLHCGLLPILHTLTTRDHTIGELATIHTITVHDAAQRVGALETRAYAHRQGPAGDIRHRQVTVTAAGRAATELDHRIQTTLQNQITAQLGTPHIDTARQVLTALIENLQIRPHATGY